MRGIPSLALALCAPITTSLMFVRVRIIIICYFHEQRIGRCHLIVETAGIDGISWLNLLETPHKIVPKCLSALELTAGYSH